MKDLKTQEIETKYCKICKQTKLITEFNKKLDKYQANCRECTKIAQRERYAIKEKKQVKDGIYCEICKEKTVYNQVNTFVNNHLMREHNLTAKEYYDKYITFGNKDNKCIHCGKETKFKSIETGYQKYCSLNCSNQDSSAKAKRIEANIAKYGVESYSQTPEFKQFMVEANSLRGDCFKEAREFIANNYDEINSKRRKSWTKELKEQVRKRRLETYDRMGITNIMQVEGVKEKVRATNESNGRWLPRELWTPYKLYRRTVINYSKPFYKEILEENFNNGFLDYYTGEKLVSNDDYLRDNPSKHASNNKMQPSVDHKVSVYFGFINNIEPEIIGAKENLCVCSRKSNSEKNSMLDSQYKRLLNVSRK